MTCTQWHQSYLLIYVWGNGSTHNFWRSSSLGSISSSSSSSCFSFSLLFTAGHISKHLNTRTLHTMQTHHSCSPTSSLHWGVCWKRRMMSPPNCCTSNGLDPLLLLLFASRTVRLCICMCPYVHVCMYAYMWVCVCRVYMSTLCITACIVCECEGLNRMGGGRGRELHDVYYSYKTHKHKRSYFGDTTLCGILLSSLWRECLPPCYHLWSMHSSTTSVM